jgi:PAS domain S-box-containing protein
MVRSSGEPREAEITTPDGRVWHIHGYPVRSEQGEIIGILEVTLEVTAKKRAEQALRESEGRFRSLFETTHEAIGASGPDGRIITANPAMARVLGLKTPKDLIGIPAVDLYADPKDREDFFRRLRAKGFVENFELTLMKQDGSRQPIYILGNATLHTDERDQLQRIDFIFSNITDR